MKRKFIWVITGCILIVMLFYWCGVVKKRKIQIIVPENLSVKEEDILYENEELYVDSQILLTVKGELSYKDVEKIVEKEEGKIIGYISFSKDYHISFPYGKTYEELNQLISKWKDEEFCESVSLNNVYRVSEESYNQDPWKSTNSKNEENTVWSEENPDGSNWWAEAICMPSVWEKYHWDKLANESVKIGVIDSVFDEKHKELSNVFEKTWENIELTPESKNLFENEKIWNHGTHVSGIIAAEMGNNYGIAGVAACAKPELYGVACFGNNQYEYSTIMEYKYAIALMLEQGVKIVNISLGDEEMLFAAQMGKEKAIFDLEILSNNIMRFLKNALEVGYDFLIVKSAGNTSGYYWKECEITAEHPYGYKKNSWGTGENLRCSAKNDFLGAITDKEVKEHIIMVGAVKQSSISETVGGTGYHIADFSNEECDVYAPGVNILSTIPMDEVTYMDGTSMATPIVTGIAGLIWTANPELSGKQVKEIIVTSANYQMLEIDPLLDLEITRKNDVAVVNAAFAVGLATIENGEAIGKNKDYGTLMGRVCYEEEGEKKYLKNVEVYINLNYS